jgi:hypothetical protein
MPAITNRNDNDVFLGERLLQKRAFRRFAAQKENVAGRERIDDLLLILSGHRQHKVTVALGEKNFHRRIVFPAEKIRFHWRLNNSGKINGRRSKHFPARRVNVEIDGRGMMETNVVAKLGDHCDVDREFEKAGPIL